MAQRANQMMGALEVVWSRLTWEDRTTTLKLLLSIAQLRIGNLFCGLNWV